MRRRPRLTEARLLPRGWTDVIHQAWRFDLERALHGFIESRIQAWASAGVPA